MTISRKSETLTDAALLLLRLGCGFCFVLLFALKQAEGTTVFVFHPGRLEPLIALSVGASLVMIGLVTRFAAGFVVLCWAWAMYGTLQVGENWAVMPMRAALFVFIFVALAITGPGKYSIDGWINSKAAE